MTSPDTGELVRRARERVVVPPNAPGYVLAHPDPLCQELADAIEQQSALLSARDQQIKVQAEKIAMFMRELAACEGALRNSGNMVRDKNNLALRFQTALKQINDYPINLENGLVSADVLDIAADALGLCRECGKTLVPQGRGCSICGAILPEEPDTRGTDTPEHGGMSG